MTRASLLAFGAALALLSPAAALAAPPQTIRLPDGFRPEGIAAGPADQLYVGSLADGAIFRVSANTGRGGLLAPGAPGRVAVGIEVALGRIFVAGGGSGVLRVQDARTGADIVEHQVLAPGEGFINDVAVTAYAAWFTDSRSGVLHALPLDGSPPVRVPLSGDLVIGEGNNLNGIAAVGSQLVAVQTNTGRLFSIDPRNGITRQIDLGRGSLPNGDGIFQRNRTLFVVLNRSNLVAQVTLDRDLRRGRVSRLVRDSDFDVPTTIAPASGWMWAVNARFGTMPTPATRYSIVRTGARDRRSA